jgi:membrane protein YdbS with pleckstrin-like domain
VFAELGLLASILLTVAGIGVLFLTKGDSLRIVAGTLIIVGALSLVVQLWIYYRRWHNY